MTHDTRVTHVGGGFERRLRPHDFGKPRAYLAVRDDVFVLSARRARGGSAHSHARALGVCVRNVMCGSFSRGREKEAPARGAPVRSAMDWAPVRGSAEGGLKHS
jgi:hypothetical protein